MIIFMWKKSHAGCRSPAELSLVSASSCILPRLLFPVEAGHTAGGLEAVVC